MTFQAFASLVARALPKHYGPEPGDGTTICWRRGSQRACLCERDGVIWLECTDARPARGFRVYAGVRDHQHALAFATNIEWFLREDQGRAAIIDA